MPKKKSKIERKLDGRGDASSPSSSPKSDIDLRDERRRSQAGQRKKKEEDERIKKEKHLSSQKPASIAESDGESDASTDSAFSDTDVLSGEVRAPPARKCQSGDIDYAQRRCDHLSAIGPWEEMDALTSFGRNKTGFGVNPHLDFDRVNADQEGKIAGLYAIVMPVCAGKTTLAARHSQLDVDTILPKAVESELEDMRNHIHEHVRDGRASTRQWGGYNSRWTNEQRKHLAMYDFSKAPRIIFIHSPEVAAGAGIEVIGIVTPTARCHEQWLQSRDRGTHTIARMSRLGLAEKFGKSELYHEFSDGAEQGRIVAHIISQISYFPGVCHHLPPSVFKDLVLKNGYSPLVPDSILMEQYTADDISDIANLSTSGEIPWWHAANWMKRFRNELLLDVADYHYIPEWLNVVSSMTAKLPAQVTDRITRDHINDPETDWTQFFPFAGRSELKANVTIRKLIKHLGADMFDTYALHLMSTHIGESHMFVTALLAYYLGVVLGLEQDAYNRVIVSGMLEVPEGSWVDVHSEIHKWVRNTQTLFGVSLTPDNYVKLQYTNLLHGRRDYLPDPQPQITLRFSDRLVPKRSFFNGVWSNEQYQIDFRAGVKHAYCKLGSRPAPTPIRNMAEFFEKRYKWAAGGAITSVPENVDDYLDEDDIVVNLKETIRTVYADPNKKKLVERMSTLTELVWLLVQNWAYNPTRVAPKPNEAAKKRTLLPGSLLHFIVTALILMSVERTGPVGGVRLGDSDDNAIYHYDMRMAMGKVSFMLDFADHNTQHSAYEMQVIMDELYRFLKLPSTEADLIMMWIVDSFDQMAIVVGHTEFFINSGLYSGWRSTTWINSVACQAYMHVAMVSARRRFGGIAVDYFEGAGDDVVLKFSTPLSAIQFYDCIIKCGYDVRDSKQLLLINGTEFLRVVTLNDTIMCCVNRALPNFIFGDYERGSDSILDKLGGAYATTRLLRRRGLSYEMTSCIYQAYIDKRMRYREYEDGPYLPLAPEYLHGMREQGAMGIPDRDDKIWYISHDINFRPKVKVKLLKAPMHASDDYAHVIKKEIAHMGIKVDVKKLRNHLVSEVYHQDFLKLEPELMPVLVGVTCKRRISTHDEMDVECLREVLQGLKGPLLTSYLKERRRWDKYTSVHAFSNADAATWKSRLGITIDVDADDALVYPMAKAFEVPEYVLYNVGMYLRARVAFKQIDVHEAIQQFVYASNAYMCYFSGNRL